MEYFRETINLKEVFVQIFAFIIVFWTLKLLAWNKILGALNRRREKIQAELEKIEKAQKSAEALHADYEARIRHIEEEAHKRLQEAVVDGKRISREIQDEARQNARNILKKTKDDVALEIQKARETLKEQIAELTLTATERLLQKKMDDKQDRELVEDIIRQIEKSHE